MIGGKIEPVLAGRKVIFGITGGIAAFKACEYARLTKKAGADVIPVLTRGGAEFVTPLSLSALTGNRCLTGMFEETEAERIPHVAIPKEADLLVVAPATADFMARAAHGMADELLAAMLLVFRGPVLFFPAMNPAMYEHPATKRNIAILEELGYRVVKPDRGEVACGDEGPGRLVNAATFLFEVRKALSPKGLDGRRILVTAGPTREPLDPVRFVSNRSSGKMGFNLALEAACRGAEVCLVTGPVSLEAPPGVRVIRVETAKEMKEATLDQAPECDVVIMSAAVADYRPVSFSEHKMKKEGSGHLELCLERTDDILAALSETRRQGQVICGFCAETEDLEDNARKKLTGKGLDLIVANDITEPGAGFDVDTNHVILLDRAGRRMEVPLASKAKVAAAILDKIETILKAGPTSA